MEATTLLVHQVRALTPKIRRKVYSEDRKTHVHMRPIEVKDLSMISSQVYVSGSFIYQKKDSENWLST